MADEHPCPGLWQWWATYDGEHYGIGPADSREEIVGLVLDDQCGEYQTESGEWRIRAHICEARQNNVDLARYFDVDDFLDRAAESMDEDDCGGNEDGGDNPVEEIGAVEKADLDRSICAAIRDWQRRHSLPLRSYWFGDTRNEEDIDLPHPAPEQEEPK